MVLRNFALRFKDADLESRSAELKVLARCFSLLKEYLHNMYINQQDAQISVIKLYFFIRRSTCFGLY